MLLYCRTRLYSGLMRTFLRLHLSTLTCTLLLIMLIAVSAAVVLLSFTVTYTTTRHGTLYITFAWQNVTSQQTVNCDVVLCVSSWRRLPCQSTVNTESSLTRCGPLCNTPVCAKCLSLSAPQALCSINR